MKLKLLAFVILLPALFACSSSKSSGVPETCCIVCKRGKPCGDTCVSTSYSCFMPKGCACERRVFEDD